MNTRKVILLIIMLIPVISIAGMNGGGGRSFEDGLFWGLTWIEMNV